MKRNLLIIVVCLLIILGGLAVLARPWLSAAPLPQPSPAPLPQPPVDAARLLSLWVHGESALFEVAEAEASTAAGTDAEASDAPASLVLRGADGRANYVFALGDSDFVNRGLPLWQLPAADYQVYFNSRPVRAERVWLPQGYTLPRGGRRLHWRFAVDGRGLLSLSVSEIAADALPVGWYDVIVDAGHGGADTGAVAGGYAEATLNLDNAYDLRAELEALGLRVALTRAGAAVPGGAAAEDNPYARDARVERVYRSHAPYLLSCHLNAGEGRQQGFQIYASVRSDAAWAETVAEAWRAAGASENNSGSGLRGHGVYQRQTEWTAQPRDYYFILRETGGYALSPGYFIVSHRDMRFELACGAEALLLEFAFMDNAADLRYWLDNRLPLLQATAAACAEYWCL